MKILIADDHTLFREGMRHVLAQLDERVEILEAATCGQALDLVAEHPDLSLLLMDIDLPDRSGLDGVARVTSTDPLLPVVVLSASRDRSHMQQALDYGAAGFIPKTATSEVMLSALRLVLAGGIYVPPEMLPASPDARLAAQPKLTPRQREVLQLIVQGHPNKTIADQLDLSEATVKAHITAIMRALEVSNRTQAVRAAQNLGLVTADL